MSRSDKGTKRSHYDMRNRRAKKEIADVMRTVDDVRERDRQAVSRAKREGRARRERRAAARDKLLPRDRVCPVCHEVKVKSRQWVVRRSRGVTVALCISCDRRQLGGDA